MNNIYIRRRLRQIQHHLIGIDTVVLVLFFGFSFFDFVNYDSLFYFNICTFFNWIGYQLPCSTFYDVKFWEGIVSLGTFSAAYFAYKSIKQSNKNLTISQMPFVVMQDRIYLTGSNKVHAVSIKNIGRGLAHNVTIKLNPFQNHPSIVDGSNPEVIHLGPGEVNTGWALNNIEFIKQLRLQGFKGKKLIKMIDEKEINNKSRTFINIYIHYFDSERNEYITQSKFKRYGNFIKVTNSDYWGMKQ